MRQRSIFSEEFLDDLRRQDSVGFSEAAALYSGPWRVEAQDDRFVVTRDGDGEPYGAFRHQETAFLVAAILPAVGSDPPNSFGAAGGCELHRNVGSNSAESVGRLRTREDSIVFALHVAEMLLRSPRNLALFLEAANYGVVAGAGRLLAARAFEAQGVE